MQVGDAHASDESTSGYGSADERDDASGRVRPLWAGPGGAARGRDRAAATRSRRGARAHARVRRQPDRLAGAQRLAGRARRRLPTWCRTRTGPARSTPWAPAFQTRSLGLPRVGVLRGAQPPARIGRAMAVRAAAPGHAAPRRGVATTWAQASASRRSPPTAASSPTGRCRGAPCSSPAARVRSATSRSSSVAARAPGSSAPSAPTRRPRLHARPGRTPSSTTAPRTRPSSSGPPRPAASIVWSRSPRRPTPRSTSRCSRPMRS